MTSVKSVEELTRLVGAIGGGNSVTNFYFNKDRHGIWIEDGVLFFEQVGGTLFLLHREEEFYHLFFVASDATTLAESLKIAPFMDETLSLDIVGFEDNPLINIFENFGFKLTETLRRMRRIGKPVGFEVSEDVVQATKEDVSEIRKLLRENFNPLTEQLLCEKEIALLVERGTILVSRINDEIKGFCIYEKQGKTLYWRYWWVNPDCRGLRIGAKLFHTMFAVNPESVRQLLFVLLRNENARVRQEHYGYQFDSLFDYVLIKD